MVRRYADEPSVSAKYDDAELIEEIETAHEQILVDLHTASDAPVLARATLDVAAGTSEYLLPPSVESILRIAKINSESGTPDWEIRPESPWSVRGPSFRLEGRVLRFEPFWQGDGASLELLYVPNGDFRLHYGTAGTVTTTTVVLATSPTLGTRDTRENAYVGAVLRIISDTNGVIQERTITAYNRTTKVATVTPAFSPALGGTVTYEVVPAYERLLEKIVALYVARSLRTIAGDRTKADGLKGLYVEARRALRIELSRRQGIISDAFEQDTTMGGATSPIMWVN